MHQHIQTRAHMQMAQLQRPRQCNDQRRIYIAQTPLSLCQICRPLFKLIFQNRRRERFGGYSAGQRRIVVDVEFEQVEEGIIDEVYRTVDLLFNSEVELQRSSSLVACESGHVRELSRLVGNVFAGVTVTQTLCVSFAPRSRDLLCVGREQLTLFDSGKKLEPAGRLCNLVG